MEQEQIIITSLEQVPAALTLLLKKFADLEIKVCTPAITPVPATKDLHTRKETAKRINVTLATLHQYTLSGKIIANRIGNRVLYRESDIQNALRQLNLKKTNKA